VSTPEERFTVVMSCQLEGRNRYFPARMALDFNDAEIISEPAGGIPAFDSEEEARSWASRLFPLEANAMGTGDDAFSLRDLQQGMEELFKSAGEAQYDVDRVAHWAASPGRGGASPEEILQVWMLLAMSGTVPYPPEIDGMSLAGLRTGMPPDAPNPEPIALAATVMKLRGMSREQQRREGRGDEPGPDWIPDPDFWSDEDDRRVAAIVGPGIRAFIERLTEDVDRVEKAIRAAPPPVVEPAVLRLGLNGPSEEIAVRLHPGRLDAGDTDRDRRSIPLTIYLGNTGGSAAKRVVARVIFPPGLGVENPDAAPPLVSWPVTLGRAVATQADNGSTVITFEIRDIIPDDCWPLTSVRVRFREWNDVRSFALLYRVHAEGVAPYSGALKVEVSVS
jgi:hypothetical protein